MDEIRKEALYFEITPINDLLGNAPTEIEFLGMEYSGPYIVSGMTIGTNSVDDIVDESSQKGICANSPGWIKIELNGVWSISEIEVRGYNGNPTNWSSDNGSSSSIKLSEDGNNWNNVGSIPSGYGSVAKKITFSATSGRYIKFESTSYLGIGYLKVKSV